MGDLTFTELSFAILKDSGWYIVDDSFPDKIY